MCVFFCFILLFFKKGIQFLLLPLVQKMQCFPVICMALWTSKMMIPKKLVCCPFVCCFIHLLKRHIVSSSVNLKYYIDDFLLFVCSLEPREEGDIDPKVLYKHCLIRQRNNFVDCNSNFIGWFNKVIVRSLPKQL